ncbi:MAG: glycosyltransferase family 2 protein [Candidatus Omnitrophica bacterium]|nr:glycosyltransferase family 2 protein [Candidatus Omnitrophota bacterium]
MKTCVIIPTYNEAQTIGNIVKKIKQQFLEVIVIDDGSQDSSADIAQDAGALVIRTYRNFGKGAALCRGFSYALKENYDAVITMDGDGQHLPEDIPVFLNASQNEHVGLVVGNRMDDTKQMPYIRKLTNKFMSWLLSYITKQKIVDSQCGFRLIKRQLLEKLKLTSHNFEIESEIILEAIRNGFQITFVPIQTVYGKEKSHINPCIDTLRFIRFISKWLAQQNGLQSFT